jgi:hypothetical protein
MLFSKKQTIEDYVVEALADNTRLTGPELLKIIHERRGKTSKQAMYTVLQTLLVDEVIAKIGTQYYLSKLWIDKVDQHFKINNEKLQQESIFNLQDKESITYRFPSLLSCDTYWAHIFNLLIVWIPRDRPFFFWLPHEWFIIGRSKEDIEMFKLIQRERKLVFYSVSGKTELDKKFKKQLTSNSAKINIGNTLPFKQNYYLNVFDDFILEIYLDKKLTEKIENFYKKHNDITLANMTEFENLIKEKYPVRMKISRDKKKAAKLRKQLSKDFYIPSEYEI